VVAHYADRPMSPASRFDPESFRSFRVTDRRFDPRSRTVTLRYALDDRVTFTETITFEGTPGSRGPAPSAPSDPDPAADPGIADPGPADPGPEDHLPPGLARALLHLHVAAGTSYYKTAAPPEVVIEGESMGAAELDLHHHLYDDGLREFAVANGLPVPRPVAVVADHGVADPPVPTAGALRPGLIVPIGGGKDSMVLIDAVRHLRPRLFAVNPHPLVHLLAAEAGLELLVVRRKLDPGLAALHEAGARNGHVPITAIVSLIAVVGAFLDGYDTVAMAVERSASEETVLVDGVPVNHQYSKSRDFELLLADVIRSSVAPELTYGSALRPYSELAISRAFARLGRYRGTFCSCNSAFRQRAGTEDRWCGHCPKCRFVGLMLAPFLEPDELTAVIGTDMFADPAQIDGFAALMSDVDKPFECVGEKRESAAALLLLAGRPAWRSTPVVSALAPLAATLVDDDEVVRLLGPDDELTFGDPEVAAAVAALLAGGR